MCTLPLHSAPVQSPTTACGTEQGGDICSQELILAYLWQLTVNNTLLLMLTARDVPSCIDLHPTLGSLLGLSPGSRPRASKPYIFNEKRFVLEFHCFTSCGSSVKTQPWAFGYSCLSEWCFYSSYFLIFWQGSYVEIFSRHSSVKEVSTKIVLLTMKYWACYCFGACYVSGCYCFLSFP